LPAWIVLTHVLQKREPKPFLIFGCILFGSGVEKI